MKIVIPITNHKLSPKNTINKDGISQARTKINAEAYQLMNSEIKSGRTKMDLADQLREDIRNFIKENGCERAVTVWCASTEVYNEAGDVHKSLKSFEHGLKNNDPAISPSQISSRPAGIRTSN